MVEFWTLGGGGLVEMVLLLKLGLGAIGLVMIEPLGALGVAFEVMLCGCQHELEPWCWAARVDLDEAEACCS